MTEKKKNKNTKAFADMPCFVCGQIVPEPSRMNLIEGQAICDSCRVDIMDSLEEAWKKHSAFLDAALN